MSSAVEICSCGHPVSKHVLWKTEYSRCEGIFSGTHMCRCSGLYRSKVATVELVGEWDGVGSRPGKYFRRDVRIEDGGSYETFNRAMEKTLENDSLSVSWELHSCLGCLSDWDGPFYAYAEYVGEEKDLAVQFLCGICNFERGGAG
jgi:hypothetical protein